MKLTLVRHTTLDIEPGICYGQSDILPSVNFEKEAAKAKKVLDVMSFDKVYSSPLKRCALLAAQCGFASFEISREMMELDFGDWELMAWDDIHGEYAQKWMDNYIDFPTLNGESLRDMVTRIQHFITVMKQQNIQHVLCFTHSGPIRIMEHLLNKKPIEELFSFEVEYAGIYNYTI